jgi:hypothetical protein
MVMMMMMIIIIIIIIMKYFLSNLINSSVINFGNCVTSLSVSQSASFSVQQTVLKLLNSG